MTQSTTADPFDELVQRYAAASGAQRASLDDADWVKALRCGGELLHDLAGELRHRTRVNACRGFDGSDKCAPCSRRKLGCKPWPRPVAASATLDEIVEVERAEGVMSRLGRLSADAERALRKLRRGHPQTHAWRWAFSRHLPRWFGWYAKWIGKVQGQDERGEPVVLTAESGLGDLNAAELENLGDFLRDLAERFPAMSAVFAGAKRNAVGRRGDVALAGLVEGGRRLGMSFPEMAQRLIDSRIADEERETLVERMREKTPQRRAHHRRKQGKRVRGKRSHQS
jgi:hypothetical protein